MIPVHAPVVRSLNSAVDSSLVHDESMVCGDTARYFWSKLNIEPTEC
jgi:hypothetical protein